MSFLTDDEVGSLRIDRMIVHVVGREAFEPQPEMEGIDHLDFFLARIQDAAISGVHRFEPNSVVKASIEAIAKGEVTFEAGAQELSRKFSKDHVGSSRDGAFFVFELSAGTEGEKIYSLVKYDYRQAIELYAQEGKNALRQIVQAFVKEKKAIQKSCLVRCVDGVAQSDVSAFDRMGDAPDLTDYFQKFLDVVRERDTKELSERLREVLRRTLQQCKAHLPNEDVAAALAATKDHLRGRDTVDDEAIREAIFVAANRPDEDVRANLDKALDRQLKDRKLAGITFKPDPQVFRRAPRRKLRTAEEVVLTYPGEQEDRAVKRVRSPDGGWTITIQTTEDLVEDATIADRVGREA